MNSGQEAEDGELDYMDKFQDKFCECPNKEFGNFNRAQAMRNQPRFPRINSDLSQGSEADNVLRYR